MLPDAIETTRRLIVESGRIGPKTKLRTYWSVGVRFFMAVPHMFECKSHVATRKVSGIWF